MWFTSRPGQTSWIRMFVAPFSADVGCAPVCGCTVWSVALRIVVHALGPGVSSPRPLIARSRFEPARCCQYAGGHGSDAEQLKRLTVVPWCVPAAVTASVTRPRRLGQYVSA